MKQEVVVKTENSSMMSASIQRQESQVQEMTEPGSVGNLHGINFIKDMSQIKIVKLLT